MPEFLQLVPPDEALRLLLDHLSSSPLPAETIDAASALGRVAAEDIRAPHPLPEFRRSTMDGYAVRAHDTFGAGESLPAYLSLVGEVPMGRAAQGVVGEGQCVLIHTGGMLPEGADAVVMLEHTQLMLPRGDASTGHELEVLRAVAPGDNVILAGEDVASGSVVIRTGTWMRPAEIGGLMALGITRLRVVTRPQVGIISSGDEVVEPGQRPVPGQVRDVNGYTLAALVEQAGGQPVMYGIVPDERDALQGLAARALAKCDAVLITAGSSASARDMTADVINLLGKPGVLVHGINTRPGKPTILGACAGKAVIGLPGNPVSALVNGYLFVVPVVRRLLGMPEPAVRPSVRARLAVNLPSQAGREDWWPVKLSSAHEAGEVPVAEPVFGKSNLIFTLARADGLLRIAADATGLAAGDLVEVFLM